MDEKKMICPLLSVGREAHIECLGNGCEWWVDRYNHKERESVAVVH